MHYRCDQYSIVFVVEPVDNTVVTNHYLAVWQVGKLRHPGNHQWKSGKL